MNRRVLVTGGAGFIGTHLIRALLEEGCEVTVFDNFSLQIHGGSTELAADIAPNVRLIHGEVQDFHAWERALPGHDTVVNLAAETGTGQSMYEVARYEQVNLAGTANLYEILAKGKVKTVERVVVASSRAVYGEGAYACDEHGTVYPRSRSAEEKNRGSFDPLCPLCGGACRPIPTPESAPFQPSSFYGLTKQVQEQMTLMFGGVLGIPSFALRYQNVYGPGQSLKNPYTGILAVFSNLARAGSDINVFEDGLESRDFVYIEDVVRATASCVKSEKGGTHVLNVGSGEKTTVLEVAESINRFFGGKSSVQVSGAFREGDIRHGMADLTRVQAEIGFAPAWTFQRGLTEFLEWAEDFEPDSTGYEQSLAEMKQKGLLHGK
jgi:dTDP-L-rhamnose 4-epimerase